MPALPQFTSSPADYVVQLEILQKIESLGGSDGYDSNMDAFNEFVPALDPFKPDVWTRSIKELAKHEDDRAARALKAKLQAELDLHHSNPKLAQKQRIYEIIKGIESLGGSVGFEKFTKKPRATLSATDAKGTVAPTTWPVIYAWGFTAGGVISTAVTIHAGDHEGTGYAWGPAFGAGNLQGTLAYESFNANTFYFQNLGGVAMAEIMLNGKLTSQFVGALVGSNAALGFAGSWHW